MLIAFMGLSFGSFLNVVIYRLPLEKSIVSPGSACPKCANPIKWHDNLPVFSYVFLRGKCRRCGAGISWRYPAIELLTGTLTVLLFLRLGINIQTGIYYLLMLSMIAVAFIDAEHFIIPDEISLGGTVVGLGLSFIHGGVIQFNFDAPWKPMFPLDALIGAAAGCGILGLLRCVHKKLTKIEGMGLGDVKLAAMIGAFIGWYGLPPVFLASSITGLLAGGITLLIQRKGARAHLPFGTFLAVGTVAYIFFENYWYDYVLTYLGK